MAAAGELLRTQPLAVRDVARLAGYHQSGQFSRASTGATAWTQRVPRAAGLSREHQRGTDESNRVIRAALRRGLVVASSLLFVGARPTAAQDAQVTKRQAQRLPK